MAKATFLTIILIVGSSLIEIYTTEKSFDAEFALKMVRMYLCTHSRGNGDWWRKIENKPMIRLMLRAGVGLYCDIDLEQYSISTHKRILKGLRQEARVAFQHQSQEKKDGAATCMWKGIKVWHVVPSLCPVNSEVYMENFDKAWADIMNITCPLMKNYFSKIFCRIGKWTHKNRNAVRKIVQPYLCRNHREKRQYDISSWMASVEMSSCLNLAGYEFEHLVMDAGRVDFFAYFGLTCCLSELVDA